MPKPIEYYFDFSSPYGYFASEKIDELAGRYGREVDWRPILLGAIFKVTGMQPLPLLPVKGDYYKHDFGRSARWFGIPFKFPGVFPISGVTPSRAFYWVKTQDPARAKQLAKALYRAFFVDDIDVSNAENTLAVAEKIGIDRIALAAGMSAIEIKERLKSEVDAALAQGVFGSPYFIVDGEPFHGADRLDQVERWLATGGW